MTSAIRQRDGAKYFVNDRTFLRIEYRSEWFFNALSLRGATRTPSPQYEKHLEQPKRRLVQERGQDSPVLLDLVHGVQELDGIAHRLGFDMVAGWQRGLSQKELTAERFYRIFSRTAAPPITDENVRTRYEAKRAAEAPHANQND